MEKEKEIAFKLTKNVLTTYKKTNLLQRTAQGES